jgi:hypothetical protein
VEQQACDPVHPNSKQQESFLHQAREALESLSASSSVRQRPQSNAATPPSAGVVHRASSTVNCGKNESSNLGRGRPSVVHAFFDAEKARSTSGEFNIKRSFRWSCRCCGCPSE